MESIKIEDFVPEDADITIGGKVYGMRKINVDDEVWLKTRFGKSIQAIFQNMEFDQIAKLIFRQLKDKSDFLPEVLKEYDDDGNAIEVTVTGPQKIMRQMTGVAEKNEAIFSVVQLIGISRPMMDKLVDEEIERKKKVIAEMEMTNQELVSQTSSTESPASTATP